MSVVYEANYILIEDADGSINQSVTIPANATFLLIAFMGYRSAGLTFTSIALGGTAITNVAHSFNSGGNYQNVVVYRMASPPTGSQTLAVTWSGTDEGGHILIVPCSGVDTSSPVRDSDANGVDGASWADGIGTLTLDSQAGDLAVTFVNSYTNAIDVDRSGQTVIVETSTAYNNDQAAAAYEAATGASISAEAYTASGYATMVTIVLAQASGGGSATGTGALASQSSSASGSGILIAYPAYGYATPDAGEIAQSWSAWHLGAGAVVNGNADYGDLIIPPTVTCSSPVIDTGDAGSKQITMSSKYGTNLGTYTRYIRGSETLFAWDDGTPSWTEYTGAVTQAWRYVQVLLTGG